MLDAYIIDEIKRQEEARRRAEAERRPRVHIEREHPRDQPVAPDPDAEIDEDDEEGGPLRIDINPTVPIQPPSMAHPGGSSGPSARLGPTGGSSRPRLRPIR